MCENKIMGTKPFGRSSGAFDFYAEKKPISNTPPPLRTTVSECLHSVLQWLCENAGMILKIRPGPLIIPPFEAVKPELLTVSSNEL